MPIISAPQDSSRLRTFLRDRPGHFVVLLALIVLELLAPYMPGFWYRHISGPRLRHNPPDGFVLGPAGPLPPELATRVLRESRAPDLVLVNRTTRQSREVYYFSSGNRLVVDRVNGELTSSSFTRITILTFLVFPALGSLLWVLAIALKMGRTGAFTTPALLEHESDASEGLLLLYGATLVLSSILVAVLTRP